MKPAPIRLAFVFLSAAALYFGGAAIVLRFELDRLLFPHTSAFVGPQAERVEHIPGADGAEIILRHYGRADRGCVVFFPGQHGYIPEYDPTAFTRVGLKVGLVAYPGQDGATGDGNASVVDDLARRAVQSALDQCPQAKVVILGVSLGAMLAIRSAIRCHVPRVIMVSAPSSLSDAIRARFVTRWYLSPLRLLPLSRVLKRDYALSEALAFQGTATIFQGSSDEQTSAAALDESLPPSIRAEVVRVQGGTHSTTFALSREAQLSTILLMLSQPE